MYFIRSADAATSSSSPQFVKPHTPAHCFETHRKRRKARVIAYVQSYLYCINYQSRKKWSAKNCFCFRGSDHDSFATLSVRRRIRASTGEIYNAGSDKSYNRPISCKQPHPSTFVSLLTKANLTNQLNRSGNFTVFAPTNAAFAKMTPATLAALQEQLIYTEAGSPLPHREVARIRHQLHRKR